MKRKLMIITIMIFTIIMITGCDLDGSFTGTIVKPSSTDDQQSYIADIKIAGAYWDRYAKSAEGKLNGKYSDSSNNYSYQRVEYIDLNQGCGSTSDCIYLYESRTYDKSKAITNIVMKSFDSEQYTTWFVDDYGNEYSAVAGLRVNGLNSSTSYYNMYDVNKGGKGKYVYLYVTYGTKMYSPITTLDIASGAYDTISGYEYICQYSNSSTYQDLNEGNSGDPLFLGISRAITGWEIYDLILIDYDLDGNMQTKTITLDTKEKSIKEEYLQAFIDKGDTANFKGYQYSKDKDVNVGDAIEYNNITIYAKWTYNITLDMSFFEEEDITYNDINFTGDLPKPSYNGYNTTGWSFKGENHKLSTGLPLNHGGTLEPILERVHVSDYNAFVEGYELGYLFDEEYNMYTLYGLLMRDSDVNPYKVLGFRCAIQRHNFDIVDGKFKTVTTTPTPVESSIDYSSLDEDQIKEIAIHAKFLMMASVDDINNTILYYQNEGKSESIVDEVILDLCEKELARR